jgi:arylsulfatase A-like enzyme
MICLSPGQDAFANPGRMEGDEVAVVRRGMKNRREENQNLANLQEPMSRAPNILWLVTTQWRAQACGYAGDPNARTPHLDRLAANGINYTQAVTPHPFGPFARAAMLTGVPSPQNGVGDYYDPLPAGTRTIAHAMREQGYATAFFGKWHLGRRDPQAPLVGEAHAKIVVPPDARGGFEFWEGFESGFLLNDPWLHGTRLAEPTRMTGYQSEVLGERAAGYLREQPAHWFAVVSFEATHPPYDAPTGGMAGPEPREIVLPPNVPRGGEIETQARRELAGYYAHIAATDRAIGRLLADLDRGDTMVFFTSVHGDMHGAHGLFRKGWPHEESVRVPLLVSGPGLQPHRDDGAISLLDLPELTLEAAAGRPLRPGGEIAWISMPSVVRLPRQCDRIWRGGRTATRKLVLNADGSPWLLFDLSADPGETRNLAADPARAAEIRALAEQWGEPGGGFEKA